MAEDCAQYHRIHFGHLIEFRPTVQSMVQSNQCITTFSGPIDPSDFDIGETPGDVFKNIFSRAARQEKSLQLHYRQQMVLFICQKYGVQY